MLVRHFLGACGALALLAAGDAAAQPYPSKTIVNSAGMKGWLVREGAEPVGNTPAEFVKHMASETAKWAKVIKAAKIQSQ